MYIRRHLVVQGNTSRNSNCIFSRLQSIGIIKPRRMLTFSQRLSILEEAEQAGSIKIKARKHKLLNIQIMDWSVNKEKLIEKRTISRDTQTIRKGPVVLNQEIEL